MSLEKAHAGYAYQDRLSVFFMLDEILKYNDSSFIFDSKEYLEDKFDDLTIKNKNGIYKKQFKYSEGINLKKNFLASDSGGYDLGLNSLYESYKNHPDTNNLKELRICTTWNVPKIGEKILKFLLIDESNSNTFKGSTLYKINKDELWDKSKGINNSWSKLKKYIISNKIDKSDFFYFLDILIIEIDLPDFSLNNNNPGKLEKIIKEQLTKIGIGTYPNDKISVNEAFSLLAEMTTRKRANIEKLKNKTIFINEILKEIGIEQGYGSIEQSFPIIKSKNIKNNTFTEVILKKLKVNNKIFIYGAPGAGKSWFVQNFQNELSDKSIKYAKHYCYVSLEDDLSSDRIKTNTFFGNLINDIVEQFPELKQYKEKLYSSDLNELNILLNYIEEDFILIIDGLDHINRIAHGDKTISSIDIDIIENLQKIKLNEYGKIIIFSQPLNVEVKNFFKIELPLWDYDILVEYLNKTSIEYDDILIDKILKKSNGNALYINYLVEELKSNSVIDIEQMPVYDSNLKSYYTHLLSGIDIDKNTIYSLTGADFRLTQQDLEEITESGNNVSRTIKTINPILNNDYSKGGMILYHESFRRYIIELLEDKGVGINKYLYFDIISWLKKKGFFEFNKSYRNLLKLLIKTGKYSDGLEYVNEKFITHSLFNGYPINLIEINQKLLAKCVIETKDFTKLMFIIENSNILGTVIEYEFDIYLSKYVEALGSVKGYEKIKEYIEYNGKPTLGTFDGLEICYILDIKGENAPWNLYLEQFDNDNPDEYIDRKVYQNYLKYYFRFLLSRNDDRALLCEAYDIINNNDFKEGKILKQEIIKFQGENKNNSIFINQLIGNSNIRQILKPNKLQKGISIYDLLNKILEKDNFYETDNLLVKTFFLKIEEIITNKGRKIKKRSHRRIKKQINKIISELEGINWFYNWCIFYIKIIYILNNKKDFKYIKLKKAFDFLILDLEPFKGSPRTSDIYGISDIIINSFDLGLSMISKEKEWSEILNTLNIVTDKTTVSLQRSKMGPLTLSNKIKLFKKHINPINLNIIICDIKKELDEDYYVYADMIEPNLDLSIYYSKAGDQNKSLDYFSKAIKYFISNGFSKDTVLDELIYSVKYIYPFNTQKGVEYIKQIEVLSKTVCAHTECGKGIKWLHSSWFSEYTKIDFNSSIIFMMNQLLISEDGYHWLEQKELADLLIKIDGTINPITELFIVKSFLNSESEEKFLNYSLNLFEKAVKIDKKIALDFLGLIFQNSTIKEYSNNRNDSKNFKQRLSFLSNKFGIYLPKEKLNKVDNHTISSSSSENVTILELIKKNIGISSINSKLTNKELVENILDNNYIPDSKLSTIFYIINHREFNNEIKEIIKILVARHFGRYDVYKKKYNKIEISPIFKKGTEQYNYYKLCLFNYTSGGWGEGFIDTKSFVEIGKQDFETAKNTLFDISKEKFLGIGFSHLMSSNLISAVSKIKGNEALSLEMYKNLHTIISYRIPDVLDSNWENLMKNDLNLNQNELLITILFTRLRNRSSERYHIVISGITYLLYNEPSSLIKPIKWFFRNIDNFLYTSKQIILEILLDYHNEQDNLYIDNFTDELNKIDNSSEYTINYIINQFKK